VRPVPEPPLRAWAPPAYRVDERGKVVGAEPGQPNNWGRWGDDDQLGTANLLTAERVARAAALARTGKRFTLGVPIGTGPFSGYRSPPLHLFSITAGDGVLQGAPLNASDDVVVMALQASTQVDGLAHVGGGDVLYNGYWAGLVTASSGARRLGIHHVAAQSIVGRAVLLDVAGHTGSRLEPGFAIGADLLDATAAAQGVGIEPGDVVLVHTGHLAAMAEGRGPEPGLSYDTIGWLHRHDVAMVAVDNVAVEVSPAEPGHRWLDFHVAALRDLGLLLGELFELDQLAADCAADGVYEGLLVASPLPVAYGVGSPLNPVFVK
jgi:kynurenine formamidase